MEIVERKFRQLMLNIVNADEGEFSFDETIKEFREAVNQQRVVYEQQFQKLEAQIEVLKSGSSIKDDTVKKQNNQGNQDQQPIAANDYDGREMTMYLLNKHKK